MAAVWTGDGNEHELVPMGADQLGNTFGGFRLSFCWDKWRIALSASQRGSRSPAFAELMM